MVFDSDALPDEPGYLAAATRAAPERLDSLLGDIQRGRLGLPNFQRDFKWDPARAQALLVSILARYPVGVLLLLSQAQGNDVFATRPITGAPPLDPQQPVQLVLDGQQRLTSLYQALFAPDEYRYFLDLSILIERLGAGAKPYDAATLEDAVIFKSIVSNRKKERELDTVAAQVEQLKIPLERVGSNTTEAWLEIAFPFDASTDLTKRKKVKRVLDIYLSTIKAHSLPVVSLPTETPVDAVCTIFETLNQRGLKLSAFDLLTARFFKDEIRLRDLWDDALGEYPILKEFGVDPYNVLQSLTLRATAKTVDGRTTGSAQRSDVMKLTSQDIEAYWQESVAGMAGTLELLRAACGVITPDYLPYTGILIPMAAVWPLISSKKGLDRTELTKRLQEFFWTSCFSGTYDQGANSQAGRDFGQLHTWLTEGRQPAIVEKPEFSIEVLETATTTRTALYKSCMALVLRRHCRDFHTDAEINATMLRSGGIESHHVFPQNWLKKNQTGQGPSTELILNRALIDGTTNRTILATPPSEYLPKIEEHLGIETLNRVLESHLLPVAESPSALMQDDYRGFLTERKALFEAELKIVGAIRPAGETPAS
ncbi:GmrSD restriction endonuclease domain-containing protein [Actinoplanes sp. CA-252034]|uniref:GmrSD restriction endonuclease domain-containing protein n=1 Tax=Actinoplanes sp. CA-252034 TaxID=3239906 RepID=UPI003D977155